MSLIANDKFWGSSISFFLGFQGFSQTIFLRFLFTTTNVENRTILSLWRKSLSFQALKKLLVFNEYIFFFVKKQN